MKKLEKSTTKQSNKNFMLKSKKFKLKSLFLISMLVKEMVNQIKLLGLENDKLKKENEELKLKLRFYIDRFNVEQNQD
jgi:hypothetical protein